ncbi:MAG TPA: hypothetical protein VHX16_14740 [Chloroflexota bacterium]|jgi:hypothetical protein|nr:hypothetical protein [Chloroflexota bacterium]
MGDKAKGRNSGKTLKTKKAPKLSKHGLRPHEERARQEPLLPKKLG